MRQCMNCATSYLMHPRMKEPFAVETTTHAASSALEEQRTATGVPIASPTEYFMVSSTNVLMLTRTASTATTTTRR